MSTSRPIVLAFYLPQFHPIPENSEWWGAGFTEWTKTLQARPLFRGHYQPHIPRDLGIYDLRLPETRLAQAALAAQYGVTAFLYWHYWFAGRRILQRPFDEVLTSGEPDFPFCLAWANQTWSGVWHGAPNRVLIEQTYPGGTDDETHFMQLLPAFTDERYLKVDGRPLFYVFRPEQLPSPAGFVAQWQSMAQHVGLPGLYLVAEVSDLHGRGAAYTTPARDGFDASAYMRLPTQPTVYARLRMRVGRRLGRPEIFPYAQEPVRTPTLRDGSWPSPTVYPNWDNTPRAGRSGLALTGSTPDLFRRHVQTALTYNRSAHHRDPFLFIKSWNEWAEGNHLEPDLAFGHGYLAALKDELERERVLSPPAPSCS